MNEEQIKEYLIENLSLEVRKPYPYDHSIICLMLGDLVISQVEIDNE